MAPNTKARRVFELLLARLYFSVNLLYHSTVFFEETPAANGAVDVGFYVFIKALTMEKVVAGSRGNRRVS